MKNETNAMREAMVRFESAAVKEAGLATMDNDEAGWVADALYLVARLCSALRESLPDDEVADRPQEIIEGLVQWDAFQEIWSRSTPRQKDYVRNLLRLHT